MAITKISFGSTYRYETVEGILKYYYITKFQADSEDDITTANAEGSEYLKYPGGSSIQLPSGKQYILNASRTEYVEATELGGGGDNVGTEQDVQELLNTIGQLSENAE